MTCQECELELGMGEGADEHLLSCAECRALAEELRLNSIALREMRVRPHWQWALAAAALIVMAVGLWPFKKPPERAAAAKIGGPTRQELPVLRTVKRVRKRKAVEPLRVKMFTSDPDVVIYWIVDKKEGIE